MPTSWSQDFPDGFDPLFERYWPRYHVTDWKWSKAQCYQESLLKPRAISPAGAMGLCQFMPATHRECVQRLNLPGNPSPFNPEVSALCSAWYMAVQNRIWTSERPVLERLKLAQAGYNAGPAHIIKAQKLCGMAPLWDQIKCCLPQVTGLHAAETKTYIERIERWYGELNAN